MPVQTQIKETGPPYWISLDPFADETAELRGQKAGIPMEDLDEGSHLHPISLPLVHLHLSSDLIQEILPTTVGDSFFSLEKTVLLLPEFSTQCLQEVALLLTKGHTSPLSAWLEMEVRQCLTALRFIGQTTNAGTEEVKLETRTAKVEMEDVQLEILLDSEAEDISEPNNNAGSLPELQKDFQEPHPEINMEFGTEETNKYVFSELLIVLMHDIPKGSGDRNCEKRSSCRN